MSKISKKVELVEDFFGHQEFHICVLLLGVSLLAYKVQKTEKGGNEKW